MDPLCEALLSQSEISPSDLHKLTASESGGDTSLQGHLDCKIMDEGSKVIILDSEGIGCGYRGLEGVNFNMKLERKKQLCKVESCHALATMACCTIFVPGFVMHQTCDYY